MPPVPPDLVRLQLRWEGLGEIAVCNLHVRMVGPGGDWQERTQEITDVVRDKIAALWPSMRDFHGRGGVLKRVDGYHLDAATGLTLHKATSQFAAGGLGGNGMNMMPLETACAVTFYGYNPAGYDPQGARKRGRIYLPYLSTGVFASDGRIGQYNQMATVWGQLINDLHGQDLTNDGAVPGNREIFPVVLSRRFGSYATIQAVSVDNLPDVQKRRQNALIPVRHTVPITQE